MTVSNPKRISIAKYQQEKCDRITADIPKGKRDAYKMIAAEKGMSLSMLIQNAVETFACGAPALPAQVAAEKLTAEEKRIVEEFAKLPADVRRKTFALIQAFNSSKGGGGND